MSWIRHNRQLFDWQILPTYVPSTYTLDTTSLYGHLKGIDLLLATLEAHKANLATVAQSGQYTDLIGAPDPANYYTAPQVDDKLAFLLNATGPQTLSGPVTFGTTLSPPVIVRDSDSPLSGIYTSHQLENGRPLYQKHSDPIRRIKWAVNGVWQIGVQLTSSLWLPSRTATGDVSYPWLASWPSEFQTTVEPAPVLESLYKALFGDTVTVQRPQTFLRVDHAGLNTVNGVYQHSGDFAPDVMPPKPLYRQIQNPDLVITWMQFGALPHHTGWVFYDEDQQQVYYYNQQATDPAQHAPRPDLGAQAWTPVDFGHSPSPVISPLTTVIEADGPRAMRFYFPAGDYLHGDGTNLFYTTADGQATNAITSN